MQIRPLHDKIIVRRLEEETRSAGGIVLPDTATEKPQQGEVLAVGPGKRDDQGKTHVPQVKVGDRIVFGQYGGNTVKFEGEEILILSENEIFGVIES